MGAARRGEATPEMAKALVAWLEDEELGELYSQLPGVEDLPCDVGIVLEGLGPAALHDALPALLARLAKVDDFGAVGVLAAALEATFGEGKAPEQASSFTPDQMELLTTLVKNHEFWTIGNATMMLSDRGLPGMRDRMAELVGVEIEDDPRDVAIAAARRDGMFIPQRALKAWLDLVERFPDDEEILVETGLMLVELDRFDEARPLFERFFATAPETSSLRGVACIGYGNTLSAAGRLEEAYTSFTKAQTLLRGENSELARQNRIAMLQQLGRPEEALAIEMERTPKDAEDFYNRGLAQVKAGKYALCIESIGRVLALSPEHANAHYAIACAYALMGNADEALASIARAIEHDPDLASDIAEDGDFDSIKDDARFIELVGDE
jgi:tetratricopeptide (TPR) repeat protein